MRYLEGYRYGMIIDIYCEKGSCREKQDTVHIVCHPLGKNIHIYVYYAHTHTHSLYGRVHQNCLWGRDLGLSDSGVERRLKGTHC